MEVEIEARELDIYSVVWLSLANRHAYCLTPHELVTVEADLRFTCCEGTSILYPTPGNDTECPVCHSAFHVRGT